MFRTLGKSKIAFVLAILFAISLFFFKGGSKYSNIFNSDTVIAKVSQTSISSSKFNRTMQMNISKFNQMIGREMTGDEIRSFNIHSLSLGALINNALFEDEFDNIDFKIDEKVIALKTRERIPKLYGSNNKLDELYLKTFLQQQQLKIEDIVQIVNFETRDQYFNDAFFNLNYPKYFSKKINDFNNHERKISYVELPLDKISVDEIIAQHSSNLNKELKLFYDKNIENYMSKEKRNVDYVVIDKESINSNIKVTSSDIDNYYNSNIKLFFQNEKRSFIQFNFKSKQEAENFKKEIKNLNLDEILNYSKDNNIRFNDFEYLEFNEILNTIAKPLFELNLNEQSKIIETSLAKHILILKSIKKPYQEKLEDAKDEIELTIRQTEIDSYYNDLLSQISDKILNGALISNIAESFNLKIKNINNLVADYEEYDEKDKAFFLNLINESFVTNKNFVSEVINLDNSLSYVFNVNEIRLPKAINIEKIEEKVLNDWKLNKKIEKINLNFEENKNNKNFINELASSYDLNIFDISIKEKSNKLPKILTSKIFNSEKNNNIKTIIQDKFYIANVIDIFINNNENEFVDISINDDVRSAFSQELMKTKKISTNDNLIEVLIQRY